MRGSVGIGSPVPRTLLRALVVVVVGLTIVVAAAGSAQATGSYPGETLSLAQSGPAVPGKSASFVASECVSHYKHTHK